MTTGFILIEVPTDEGSAWFRPDAVTSIKRPLDRYNGVHLEPVPGSVVNLAGDDAVYTTLTVAEVVELLQRHAVRWEDGDETLTPANKLMSGSVPSVPVALPLLERLLADADASPNNATSTYERNVIGAAITNVRAGRS